MNDENVIEWIRGEGRMTLSLTSKKHINKVKNLAEKNPGEIDYVENLDGSMCAHLPLSYLKLTKPRELNQEQRDAARDRLLSGLRKKEGESDCPNMD